MASTYTTNKRIEKPGYNSYASEVDGWAGPVNADWDIIDKGFGGVLALNATGAVGTVNLNITQTQNLIINVTGAMTDNATYTLPVNSASSGSVAGQWIVNNAATTAASKIATSTGASGTGSVATLTHSASVTFAIGSTIVVTGMTPAAYNGTYTVTNSSAGSVSFASTATGAQTGAGTITNSFFVNIVNIGGGTSVSIPQGSVQAVCSDGTNVKAIGMTTSQISALLAQIDVNAGTGLTGGGPLSGDVTLAADFATPLEWRSNTNDKILEPPAIWSSMAETTLTDAATIAWDMQTGFDFIVTLNPVTGASRAVGNPTNTKVGQKGRLIIQQPGSGGPCTVTWGSNFKFANGVAPTLSTTAGAIDVLYYDVRSSTYIIISLAGRAFA
jgi:hypothetical protein